MSKKDFITGFEFSRDDVIGIIENAIAYKNGRKKLPDLSGDILTLVFANASLRTRLSFESGMKKMGGMVNVISPGDTWNFEYADGAIMNGSTQEHVKEAARVISKYSTVMALRKSELITTGASHGVSHSWEELRKDEPINAFAKYASVPVINMESNMFHPCQAMADMMTMIEELKNIERKKYVLTWAPHPKALPLATPHSQMLLPAFFGMDVTVANPPGFDLDSDMLELAKKYVQSSGGSFSVSHDQKDAIKNADVVVAKSWASLEHFGKWEEEYSYRAQFADWTVDAKKMSRTNNAIFMHCLPVRRNVVVTDEVLDGKRSLIIQEAENRMWVQMGILEFLLT